MHYNISYYKACFHIEPSLSAKKWLEYAVICGHRNLKYMYIYFYMHVLKTAQKIVKRWVKRLIFHCTLVLWYYFN